MRTQTYDVDAPSASFAARPSCIPQAKGLAAPFIHRGIYPSDAWFDGVLLAGPPLKDFR
jgi:hypothetical protein